MFGRNKQVEPQHFDTNDRKMCEYDDVKRNIRDEVLSRVDTSKQVSDKDLMRLVDNVTNYTVTDNNMRSINNCYVRNTNADIIGNENFDKIDNFVNENYEYDSVDKNMNMNIDFTKENFAYKERISRDVFNSIRRYDILQELLDDDEISEIMINGYDSIFIERHGKIMKLTKKFESNKKLEDIIQKMVSSVNRVVNESNPIVDARLADGSRINVVLPPVSISGPIVTIRKFPKRAITVEELINKGAISEEVAIFLKKLVVAKYNIFISGGTSTGKTTFLNALSNYIPNDERVITIEDSAELQIRNIPNLVSLEVRNSNTEGVKKVSIRDLIKTALRMRPDRIIVGEVRDEAANDLLNAYNTGHEGSLSTGHANSTYDMLSRLESMILMGVDMPVDVIRKKIASAIDIVIHLTRLPNKKRCVMEISEVIGYKDGEFVLNKLFEYKYGEGVVNTGNKLVNVEKLKRTGLIQNEL